MRQQPPPPQHQNAFRPMRSHSPANAAAMTERQRRVRAKRVYLREQSLDRPNRISIFCSTIFLFSVKFFIDLVFFRATSENAHEESSVMLYKKSSKS